MSAGSIPVYGYKEPTIDDPISWNDYAGLRRAFNAWRERRNISFEELDELAGVPKGYSAKIFSPKGLRRVGMKSLLWYCDALGINGELRHNPEAFERIKSRLNGRTTAQVRGGTMKIEFTTRHFRKIQAKGRRSRWAKMTKEQRAAHARRLNKIRWHGKASRAAGTSRAAKPPAAVSRRRPRNTAPGEATHRAATRSASMPV